MREPAPDPALIALLSPAARLAWVYAPRSARSATLGLLALDARLAKIVRATNEPLLGQMRLAWWRDRLREQPASWPLGEPVLAALSEWGDEARGLSPLVDGWEELLGDAPLAADAFERFAGGRAAGWCALSSWLGQEPELALVRTAGAGWALADLAAHLGDADERATMAGLLHAQSWPAIRLPHKLRSLAVLYALARQARGKEALLSGPSAMVVALRVGIVGS